MFAMLRGVLAVDSRQSTTESFKQPKASSKTFVLRAVKEGHASMLVTKLIDDCNGAQNIAMAPECVSESGTENPPILEPAVHCFMARASASSFHLFLRPKFPPLWRSNKQILTHASIVCFHLLSESEPKHQFGPKDAHVGPLSTSKWAVDPNDVSGLDADAKLTANAGSMVLV